MNLYKLNFLVLSKVIYLIKSKFKTLTKCETSVLISPFSSSHGKGKVYCAKPTAILSGRYFTRKCKEKECHTLILALKTNRKG